ncbi:MAG: hypothetical protein K5648_10680 [Erysipelotrichaceae bacterium]|nr:hypothetical protein [Erysipelotrichaceae bacterium]
MEYKDEIREALTVCDQAMEDLNDADRLLKSARNWGIFDIFGGGLIATFVKRNKMDRARSCAEKASTSLRKLKEEMQDIYLHVDVDLNMDDFLSFSDYFFEGLFFADIQVQNRINTARNKVLDTIEIVRQIKMKLLAQLISLS